MFAALVGATALAFVELAGAAALVIVGYWSPQRRQRLALYGAAGVLAVAASPPMHSWATTSVSGHMVQHVLLVLVAAPLVAAGSSWLSRRLALSGRDMSRAVRSTLAPVIAAGVHVVVVWAWHVPAWYDAALASWWLHLVEHATLLASAVWWWAAVLHHAARRNPLPAAGSLMAVASGGAVLGVLLMFAPAPAYSIGSLTDQQTAGAIMAFAGGVYGATALVLIGRSLARAGGSPLVARAELARRVTSRAPVIAIAATVGVCALAVSAQRADGSAAGADPIGGAAPPEELVAEGQELYRRDCAACHGPAGEGSRYGVAIDDVGPAGVFYAINTGRMPIAHLDAAVNRSEPVYTSHQIAAIVEYSRRFVDGPDLPAIDRDAPTDADVDLARGGELYRLHCAACHGAIGIGGAQAFGREAPPVLHAEPADVAAAIVAGPGGMPGFTATFDDTEIASISAYVEYLQDPPRTGIAVPGSRVGEGLVGWLVGAGVLALLAAWIGVRR